MGKQIKSKKRVRDYGEVFTHVPEEPKEDGIDNIIALAEAYSSYDSEIYPKEIVEKLKAWKRLKDKGFKFERWQFLDDRSGIWVQGNLVPDIVDELDLLFSGEDD